MTATAAVLRVLGELQEGFVQSRNDLGLWKALDLYQEEVRFMLRHKPWATIADLMGLDYGNFASWLRARGMIA